MKGRDGKGCAVLSFLEKRSEKGGGRERRERRASARRKGFSGPSCSLLLSKLFCIFISKQGCSAGHETTRMCSLAMSRARVGLGFDLQIALFLRPLTACYLSLLLAIF